jgi:hypothetical protein
VSFALKSSRFGGGNGDHFRHSADPCRVLVCAETLVRQDPRFVWLVGLAIVVEFAASMMLIARQNANFLLAKEVATPPVP